jgi:uncharacterized protein YjbI with pentapeptide repeats/heme/copper-type cytochrome/quinol oxidase subunit 4
MPATVMAMAEDKGTSTPKQENEQTRGVHIPRVVVVGFWFSLITFSIAVFFFAGGGIDNRAVLWGIRTVAVLAVIVALWRLIRIGYDYQWTGLGEAELPKRENVEIRPKKTVWDWLQLLIVPLALAIIGFVFTMQQDARQQAIENKRAKQAQEIENQRAKQAQEIEELRAEHATLQAYLDQMGTLLLDRNLRGADENSDVRRLARGRTLIVLDALSADDAAEPRPYRQVRTLRFLYEAELIQPTPTNDQPVISLNNADLTAIDLTGRPFLRGAHLQQAHLSESILDHVDLRDAYLAGADLRSADLERADLEDANLSAAFLEEADLSGANLANVDLSNAEWIYKQDPLLRERGAGLRNADLRDADLKGANLTNANLKGANLKGAEVTDEQLASSKSLEGAIMPNGQKYEDWIKSTGRGEDGENSGPS